MKLILKILWMHALMYSLTLAETLPFTLNIAGHGENITKNLELSDLGEGKTDINFDFYLSDRRYNFDLKSVKLPSNRSYPANLDITIKNAKGEKLGYIFYAYNGVYFLKQMGEFGLILNILGRPVNFKFTFDATKKSHYSIANLGRERFMQDTLIPKFGFQMIRPVVIPKVCANKRSQTYKLDHHPYSVNYTLLDIQNGLVQFQHNLYHDTYFGPILLERFYFNVDNVDTLRESMYAVKYFDKDAGTFKLVYYATKGQLTPAP